MSGPDRPVLLSTAPLRGEGLERLRARCDVILDPWIEHVPLVILDSAALAARVAESGATILVAESDSVKREVLDQPLSIIGSTRGDPTNVDLEGATAKGIPVVHTPGRNADGVAEMTIALLMAVNRHLIAADRDGRNRVLFRDDRIAYQHFRAWQVAGSTVGIVGLGAVGRAAKWRFEGLGMKVIAADPFSPDATHEFDDLLAEADVVSMHAAVTPETFGLMNASKFALMRPGAMYLNSARAGLHDLDALTDALISGHLSGAGLDHFEGERLPKDHPIIGLDNVVLTPHIGGATYNTETTQTTMIADDILALLDGRRPAHCANPEVLEARS